MIHASAATSATTSVVVTLTASATPPSITMPLCALAARSTSAPAPPSSPLRAIRMRRRLGDGGRCSVVLFDLIHGSVDRIRVWIVIWDRVWPAEIYVVIGEPRIKRSTTIWVVDHILVSHM